ncbi:MAG TPA: MFS transporter [Pyrinomonadaceae bacterium]|nr:MFS transporter [Pyrinomonadaceae bacterium]
MSNTPRTHLDPVSWLFGRDLIASLKGTILYSVYGAKIDARAWMHATECVIEDDGKGEFWFDYISDTGDSTRATYSIAYLAMSNLYVKQLFQDRPSNVEDTEVTLEHEANKLEQTVLPRGQFLFVGGDTTYHMSDYPSLSNRFQNPFKWAFEDLKRDLAGNFDERRRLLFGIPGNHDYYDLLDGFQRQFREPVRDDRKTYMADDPTSPQLRLLGFERRQDASYVALRLPFNWRLWGLDTDVGKIDERQQEFFKSLLNPDETADRLIVATSAPTTVFGQYARKDDEKASKAFFALDLPREFLPAGDSRLDPDEGRLRPNQCRLDIAGDIHHYARYWGNNVQRGNPQDPIPRKGRSNKVPESRDNYASVVSGLGGAFHHPLMTYRDEVREQVLYPPENKSRRAVADKVFDPWAIKTGGWVWALGLIMAFVVYFSATHVHSSRQAVSNSLPLNYLGVAERVPFTPTVPSDVPHPPGSEAAVKSTYSWGPNAKEKEVPYRWSIGLLILSLPLVIFAVWMMEQQYKKFVDLEEILASQLNKLKKDSPSEGSSGKGSYGEGSTEGDVDLGDVLIHGEARGQATAKQKVCLDALAHNKALVSVTNGWLYVLATASLAVALLGLILMIPYRNNNTPFGNSLMVLLTVIWAVCAVILSLRYSDWLQAQTARRPVAESEWWVTGALNILAVLSVAVGLWTFGKNNLPAFLLSDIIFVITIIATIALLIFVIPLFLGASYNTTLEKFRLVVFGVWHAILQIFVAFYLVRKGTLLTLLLAGVVMVAFIFFGRYLMRKFSNGWRLVVAWLSYGVIMLFLPWLVFSFLTDKFGKRVPWLSVDPSSDLYRIAFWPTPAGAEWLKSFQAYEWWAPYNALVANEPVSGWWGIVPAALAGLVGAAMCCVWFGWYLGVSSLYNSHYNEAGGAARIEKFKQFVRIRLTPDTLTGYVIAVDSPREDGKQLEPKLIDVFHIKAS